MAHFARVLTPPPQKIAYYITWRDLRNQSPNPLAVFFGVRFGLVKGLAEDQASRKTQVGFENQFRLLCLYSFHSPPAQGPCERHSSRAW